MCVERAVETSRPLIDGAHHALIVSVPTTPLVLHADPVRLAQVLTNLLNNAAKYTEPGGRIALEARREGDEAVIVVQDNGLGHRDGPDRARVRPLQPGRAFDRACGGRARASG